MKKSVKFKPKKQEDTVQEQDSSNAVNQPSFLPWRFTLAYALLAILAIALIWKSFSLQVLDSERLIKEANDRSLRTKELPFTRGKILDRNGRVLSISVPMYSITIDPKEYFDTKLRRSKSQWRALAMELETSASKIEASVNNFIKAKPQNNDQKYDARAILNSKSEDYWTLLARATGLDYNQLIQRVRNNPESAFLRLENEYSQLERQKMQELAKALGMKYNDMMDKMYSSSNQRFLYLSSRI